MNFDISEFANKLSEFLMQPIRFQNYEINLLNITVINHTFFKSIISDTHPFFEFNYILDGQLYTTINDKEFFVDKGNAFLVPPRCRHSHRNFKNTEYTDLSLAFTIKKISLEECEEDIFSPLFTPYSETFDPHFEKVFFYDDVYINQLVFIRWIIMLLGQIVANTDISCSENLPTYISDRVIHYLNENFASKLDVHALANKLNMSYGHLSRTFRSETGTTIIAELKAIRINYAKKLLLTTNLSVREIAQLCGYENEQYFHRTFYGQVHMTPLNFRNKIIYK